MQYTQDISVSISSHFDQEVEFLRRLVRARSTNPFTPEMSSPDVPVEKEVATVIMNHLQILDFPPPELYGQTSHRPNVICNIPSGITTPTENVKTLILTTHMDTVKVSSAYTRDPFGGEIEHGRLYGVGAADAKAQIAAFIYAVYALRQVGISLRGNIQLAFVVDEESGASSPFGTRYLLEQGLLKGDTALVGEPGDRKISIGHRGVYRFRIQTTGEAVHTGTKEWEQGTRGHNAAVDMARLALSLSQCPLPYKASASFPGRKPVLTFPTLIQGGEAVNMVPGLCEAYGEVRLLPGTSEEEIRQTLIQCLDQHLDISYRLETVAFVPSAEIAQNSEIVQCLSSAIESLTGQSVRREGGGPACDGWMFISRGIPAICGFGVGCGGVHGADEWADLKSLQTITQIYAHTIVRYLGEV